MAKKIGDTLYRNCHRLIVMRKGRDEFIFEKELFRILGELCHVPKEQKKKVIEELIFYGYIEPAGYLESYRYRVLGA